LNILCIPLAWTSFPSSVTMILRFSLLMELLSSYIFLSQFLSCVIKSSSVFSLISILSLSSETLSSPFSAGVNFHFAWLKGLFISRISVWGLFSEVFHVFVQHLFYILCSLFHMSLFLQCPLF
jgi:hypothetical protein